MHEGYVLTTRQMRDAEARAIEHGVTGWQMMQRAGSAVVERIAQAYPKSETLVLCGPGNNGGDGFVIAEGLRKLGWHVTAAAMNDAMQGDAATARKHYEGKVVPLTDAAFSKETLIVDALFGTGLDRLVEGEAADLIGRINAHGCPVVAVDIPSGIHGDSGEIMGIALIAEYTVTFAAKKPGHLLVPGKMYAGKVSVADIGIGSVIPREAKPGEGSKILCSIQDNEILFENHPDFWRENIPWPDTASHKYTRGKALVVGGGIASTGAARLAAMAALRSGAGYVSVVCDRESLPVYASHLTSVVTEVADDAAAFSKAIADARVKAVLVGPGNGVNQKTKTCVSLTLAKKLPTVLDADALSVFAGEAMALKEMIHAPTILTPHEGEFERLFSSPMRGRTKVEVGVPTDSEQADNPPIPAFPLKREGKTIRAQEAARFMNAVVVLKGNDTVIAAPDGRIAINSNGSPFLATAGSGDVLAGIITGLLAQGMEMFDAACAGVWIQGNISESLGPGLIAEDLLTGIVKSLRDLININ